MTSRSALASFAACLLLVAVPLMARAHDPGLSVARVLLREDAVEARIDLDLSDASSAPLDARALALRLDGRPLAPSWIEPLPGTDGGAALRLVFPRAAHGRLTIEATLLTRLPPGHKQVLRVERGEGVLLAEALLSAESPSLALDLRAQQAPRGPLAGYFRAGAEHVLAGADHLLFLLVLLLGAPGLAAVARLVTAFTAAHALSLAAVVAGFVPAGAAWIEPAIAASVVYAAARCAFGARPAGQAKVAFGFGLVHGLGLAGALAALGLGGGAGFVGPLAAFNLGVEAVQLAIAALVVPLLASLRRAPRAERLVVVTGSLAALAAGAFWLVERTLRG